MFGVVDYFSGKNASKRAKRGARAKQRMMKPWIEAGDFGREGYLNLLENPESIRDMPGYQWGMNEGIRNIGFSGSAKGMNLSGLTLRGLSDYNQNYAMGWRDNLLKDYSSLMDIGKWATGEWSSARDDQTKAGMARAWNLSNAIDSAINDGMKVASLVAGGPAAVGLMGASGGEGGSNSWNLGNMFNSGGNVPGQGGYYHNRPDGTSTWVPNNIERPSWLDT